MDLSPIKASPPGSPLTSAAAKENISTFNKLAKAANATNARRPFGVLSPSSNLPRPPVSAKPSTEDHKNKRKGRALGDVTSANRSNENANHGKAKESSSVRDRMREWEKEKERLREMSKLEEMERERDEHLEEKKIKGSASASAAVLAIEQEKSKENTKPNASSPNLLPMPVASTPLTHGLYSTFESLNLSTECNYFSSKCHSRHTYARYEGFKSQYFQTQYQEVDRYLPPYFL